MVDVHDRCVPALIALNPQGPTLFIGSIGSVKRGVAVGVGNEIDLAFKRCDLRDRRDYDYSREGHAASRFDGSWTVQITTRRGACDPSSSFGFEIHDGVVSSAASGRVSKSGAVSVSVSSGGSYASGSGRLSTSSGGGSWHGVGSRGACSGTWVAGRR